MAADTIDRGRAGGHVLFDLRRVVVVVAVEVADMTLGTGAAGAAIDPGIAVAVGTVYLGAIGAGVTDKARILVNSGDDVAAMAVDTEGGGRNLCRMIMTMGTGEIISPVAADTR